VPTDQCEDCEDKESVIAEMLDKLELLQKTVDERGDLDPALDFDLILKNIEELNGILTENQKEIVAQRNAHGNGGVIAKFQAHPVTSLVFYSNGFRLDDRELREFCESHFFFFWQDEFEGQILRRLLFFCSLFLSLISSAKFLSSFLLPPPKIVQ
jgi:hypothetical protein